MWDFITETEKEVVFIEYKNGNIENAVNPDAMLQKIKHESFYHKIARKFYDSLLVFWACKGNEKELPIGLLLFFIEKLADGFTTMVGEGRATLSVFLMKLQHHWPQIMTAVYK